MAGLSAARTLLDHDVDVELYEASERIGGRARTVYPPNSSLPVELGPEFVHGDPELTEKLARDPSITIDEVEERHHLWRAGELVPARDVWERFGKLVSRVDASRDESARAYMQRIGMTGDDAELFAGFVEGFYGADLNDISMASVAEDGGGAGGDESPAGYRVRDGYGRIVDALGLQVAAAPLHLGCVVEAIDWRVRPVRITVRRDGVLDEVLADRVIVTVPLGVLQARAIRFYPALGDHQTAIARLAMGQVAKLVLRLREPLWHDHAPDRLDFVHGCDGGFPTYWMRSRGDTHLLTAWAGGRHARALAGESVDQWIERAVVGFATATGLDRHQLAAAVSAHYCHDYAADPFTRGAYSYVRAGARDAVAQLARPLGDTVFFAGEATHVDYEGTVAGALASGERAARQVLVRATILRLRAS